MARTRLVNLSTVQLEEYVIGKMPPYIAVSHVWTEALFPTTAIKAMKKTVGMSLVFEALKQLQAIKTSVSSLGHCWIDTWCINQSDAQDKHMQIPSMGNIYRDAELVMIVTDHRFSFSQQDWDTALGKAKPIFMAYFQYFEDPSQATQSIEMLPKATTDVFGSLVKMLGEVATIPWASRIWTAQEYILARSQCWIGADKSLLCLTEHDMDYILRAAELFQRELGIDKVLVEPQRSMINEPQNMHSIKAGDASRLKTMSFAKYRRSLLPKDQIYGLMGATGVIIKHEESDSLESAWQKWCETAVREGHIDILCTAAMRTPASFLDDCWNCVTPTWKDRCDIFINSYLPSIRSTNPPTIRSGTVSLRGRVAGLCLIDRYLCSGALPTDLEALAAICGDDLVLAEKVCCAEDGGVRPEREVKQKAKAIHAAHTYMTAVNLTSQEQIELQQTIDAFSAGILSRLGLGTHTHIYLARLVNASNSRDILVFTDEDLYEDEALLALDLTDDWKAQPHPLIQLLVARAPPDSSGALHKAGMTSLVKVHNLEERDVDECGCEGYSHSEESRELKLGGFKCWYCKEMKEKLADELKTKSTLPKDWSSIEIKSGNVDDWCTMDPGADRLTWYDSAKTRLLNVGVKGKWLVLCLVPLACAYLLYHIGFQLDTFHSFYSRHRNN